MRVWWCVQVKCVAQDHACEAMELFDELIECEVAIVVPYLSSLLEFCLKVGVACMHTHTSTHTPTSHTRTHTCARTHTHNLHKSQINVQS